MLKSRKLWLGLCISALFLSLFFARTDFSDIGRALKQANYLFVLPGMGLYFLSVLFRTLRWKYILHPMKSLPITRLFPVVVVGYMANNLLPMRLGEVVRSYYLGEREAVSKTTAMATIIVERVYDGLALLFLLMVASLFLPMTGLVTALGESAHIPPWILICTGTLPFVISMILLISMAIAPKQYVIMTNHLIRPLPPTIAVRVAKLQALFIDGIVVLRHPGRLATVFLISLPVWLLEAAMYYIVAFSFGLENQFASLGVFVAGTIMVTSISNLATAIPSSQGSVGPFEFFAAVTLVFLGVEHGQASAYALVLHVALLAPITILGLIYLWIDNLPLPHLTRRAQAKRAEASTYPNTTQSTRWRERQ